MPPSFTPEAFDDVLKKMEDCIRKVEAAQGSVVQLSKVELDLLGQIASARDFMNNAVQKPESRSDLENIFGGDRTRIARARAVSEAAKVLNTYAGDQRLSTCLSACESVEKVLSDLGLGIKLQQPQQHQHHSLRTKVLMGSQRAEGPLHVPAVDLLWEQFFKEFEQKRVAQDIEVLTGGSAVAGAEPIENFLHGSDVSKQTVTQSAILGVQPASPQWSHSDETAHPLKSVPPAAELPASLPELLSHFELPEVSLESVWSQQPLQKLSLQRPPWRASACNVMNSVAQMQADGRDVETVPQAQQHQQQPAQRKGWMGRPLRRKRELLRKKKELDHADFTQAGKETQAATSSNAVADAEPIENSPRGTQPVSPEPLPQQDEALHPNHVVDTTVAEPQACLPDLLSDTPLPEDSSEMSDSPHPVQAKFPRRPSWAKLPTPALVVQSGTLQPLAALDPPCQKQNFQEPRSVSPLPTLLDKRPSKFAMETVEPVVSKPTTQPVSRMSHRS